MQHPSRLKSIMRSTEESCIGGLTSVIFKKQKQLCKALTSTWKLSPQASFLFSCSRVHKLNLQNLLGKASWVLS